MIRDAGKITKWKYPTKVEGTTKNVLSYDRWGSIKKRCKISGRTQTNSPTYVGCTYAPEWESYDNFHEWSLAQIGFNVSDDKGYTYHLDKDILFKGNKHYSPETCVFIPRDINVFLVLRGRLRGEHPCGVYFKKNLQKFVAQIATGNGCQKYLGRFDTVTEAFTTYKTAKEAYARVLAIKYAGLVDPRVIDVLNNFEVNIND